MFLCNFYLKTVTFFSRKLRAEMAKMTSALPCKMQEAVTSSAVVQVALTNILARELAMRLRNRWTTGMKSLY